jgi:hypothetical protein
MKRHLTIDKGVLVLTACLWLAVFTLLGLGSNSVAIPSSVCAGVAIPAIYFAMLKPILFNKKENNE